MDAPLTCAWVCVWMGGDSEDMGWKVPEAKTVN